MNERNKLPRREFLKRAAGTGRATTYVGQWPMFAETQSVQAGDDGKQEPAGVAYPRVFQGTQLKTIASPLGGVAAGSLSLGGLGQLRDWEIFNRPDKGSRLCMRFQRSA